MRTTAFTLAGVVCLMTGCGLQVDGLANKGVTGGMTDGGIDNAGGSCRDLDGDGHGAGCERGPDCDDGNPSIFPGQRESCDFVDNDCDGQVDEGLDLGTPCEVHLPACTVPGITTCDNGGLPFCNPVDPLVEVCNGMDDDCDRIADEDIPPGDEDCQTGLVGACAVGRHECVDGALACQPVVRPTEQQEVCNGEDDDCDGFTDESDGSGVDDTLQRECYLGPEATRGVGACQDGTQTCTAGQWGFCTGQVVPANEICDGIDNDCNNRTDDVVGPACTCHSSCTTDADCDVGETCTASQCTRSCYSGPVGTAGVGLCAAGTQKCGADGHWGACSDVTPAPEQCNGQDEDCDGVADAGDGTLGEGALCSVGLGTCRQDGALGCTGAALECDIDTCESPVPDCKCTTMADCGSMEQCYNGYCIPRGNTEETCDGEDDDCDGFVDEGTALHSVGDVCVVGHGLCVRQGTIACTGADGLDFSCNVLAGQPSPEVCDGLDNDCDCIDDDSSGDCHAKPAALQDTNGDGVDCGPGDDGVCGPGDNNVDEGLGLGQPCTVGVGTCQRGGFTLCDGRGGVACDANAGSPVDEVCNGLDDDCDGVVDDGLGLGNQCDGAGACGLGVRECDGSGGVHCSTEPGGSHDQSIAEVCTPPGSDEDCDGTIDEGCP